MGISLPKLPNGVLESWMSSGKLAKSMVSGFVNNPFSGPQMIGTPEWAELNDKYLEVAYKLPQDHPTIVMVEYKPRDEASADFPYGYSRFYVVGPDGKSVPYNENMWKQLHKDNSTKTPSGYEIDSEGRATMLGRSIKATEADIVSQDMTALNHLWRNYPTAKDFDTVKKLHEGQIAIDKLKSEERYKRIDTQIKSAQESIKAEQEHIAKLEKELNKVYEDAADAMNYFEEQGIKPNMEGDGEPRKATDSSGMPSGMTFKGTGTILEIPNSGGQAKVYPDSNAHPLSVGDFIVDTKSGRQAMLGTNKKWYLIC